MAADFHARDLAILRRLLAATRAGQIAWGEEDDAGYFTAELAGREIHLRRMWYEATNQIGADPRAFEVSLPGANLGFFAGTEGWSLVLDILDAGRPEWRRHHDRLDPLAWLDAALAAPGEPGGSGPAGPAPG